MTVLRGLPWIGLNVQRRGFDVNSSMANLSVLSLLLGSAIISNDGLNFHLVKLPMRECVI